jgi:hypothetical protein
MLDFKWILVYNNKWYYLGNIIEAAVPGNKGASTGKGLF